MIRINVRGCRFAQLKPDNSGSAALKDLKFDRRLDWRLKAWFISGLGWVFSLSWAKLGGFEGIWLEISEKPSWKNKTKQICVGVCCVTHSASSSRLRYTSSSFRAVSSDGKGLVHTHTQKNKQTHRETQRVSEGTKYFIMTHITVSQVERKKKKTLGSSDLPDCHPYLHHFSATTAGCIQQRTPSVTDNIVKTHQHAAAAADRLKKKWHRPRANFPWNPKRKTAFYFFLREMSRSPISPLRGFAAA